MRRLKVTPLYQPRRFDGVKVSQIRLIGRWLESAGFTPGARVHVHVEEGKLLITTEANS